MDMPIVFVHTEESKLLMHTNYSTLITTIKCLNEILKMDITHILLLIMYINDKMYILTLTVL